MTIQEVPAPGMFRYVPCFEPSIDFHVRLCWQRQQPGCWHLTAGSADALLAMVTRQGKGRRPAWRVLVGLPTAHALSTGRTIAEAKRMALQALDGQPVSLGYQAYIDSNFRSVAWSFQLPINHNRGR